MFAPSHMLKLAAFFLLTSSLVFAEPSCKCGSTLYSSDDVDAAMEQGQETNPFPVFGTRSYPHRFGNREQIDFKPHCDSEDYVEFPLKQGVPYTGGAPGADRVIYSTENAFCGV
ncbi:hypothetical protein D9756_008803 [Leucocoprinus leucothites]|uniref:Uncharacterized protein n=1 Tax=Leucocoprinus leucothites TaxID=201217 RepID=A0A8H5FTV3_9AGAR|nr:hypothetical protein D9756_008803 [Leucoagaricus leucothites]